MNVMRKYHGDCSFVAFDSVMHAEDRVAARHDGHITFRVHNVHTDSMRRVAERRTAHRLQLSQDNPNPWPDIFYDTGRTDLTGDSRCANDCHSRCSHHFCMTEYGTASGLLH